MSFSEGTSTTTTKKKNTSHRRMILIGIHLQNGNVLGKGRFPQVRPASVTMVAKNRNNDATNDDVICDVLVGTYLVVKFWTYFSALFTSVLRLCHSSLPRYKFEVFFHKHGQTSSLIGRSTSTNSHPSISSSYVFLAFHQ